MVTKEPDHSHGSSEFCIWIVLIVLIVTVCVGPNSHDNQSTRIQDLEATVTALTEPQQ